MGCGRVLPEDAKFGVGLINCSCVEVKMIVSLLNSFRETVSNIFNFLLAKLAVQ